MITANIAIPQMHLWYLKQFLFNRISENTLKDKSDFAIGQLVWKINDWNTNRINARNQ